MLIFHNIAGILRMQTYSRSKSKTVLIDVALVSPPPTQVSFEDVDRLKAEAQMENTRIPYFMQDQVRYGEQLEKIMTVNLLTDEELQDIV